MKEELNEKTPQLAVMAKEAEELIKKINKEFEEIVGPKQAIIEAEEAEANIIAQEAAGIKADCDANLAEALPILKKAQDALKTIKPEHINEIRVLKKPPGLIRKVLHSICIMLKQPAIKT
jgi:dynein heavy chain